MTVNLSDLSDVSRRRGTCCQQADHQDGLAVRHQGRKARVFENTQDPQRQGDQPQEGHLPDAADAQDRQQVLLSHEHAGDKHAEGADGGGNGLHGTGDYRRQGQVQQKQQHTHKHGNDVDIQENFFQRDIPVTTQNNPAVTPHGKLLHQLKHAAIDDPLRPQDRSHQGDDEVTGIGVNQGGLFHRRQTQGAVQ